MKKTVKTAILICVLLLICVLGLSACDGVPQEPLDSNGTDASTESNAQIHSHTFGEWSIVKAPTCAEKGEQARVCGCGEKETSEIDKISHTYTNGFCLGCGESLSYELFYESNGDGTCYVSAIKTYPTYDKNYVLEIPEVSPNGDRVTSICSESFAASVPLMLLPQDYAEIDQALSACVDRGEVNQFYYVKFGTYFISSAEQKEKNNLDFLSKYPIAQAMDVYVLDDTARDFERMWIFSYLISYTDYTEAELAEDYRNLYAAVNESDATNKAELLAALPQGPSHGRWIREIVLPNSITSIEQGAFDNCENLDRIYYAGSKSEWDEITIDLTDGTNAVLTYATRYYYSETQPETAGNYWHYVDGVPTSW